MLYKLIYPLYCILFPPTCYFCQIRCKERQNDICQDCEKTLHFKYFVCKTCCLPLITNESQYCGHCQKSPPLYSHLICIGLYEKELRHLIIQFKFHQKLYIGKLLGKILAKKITQQESLPECIIPVPLHKKRLGQRGFNQAKEIAQELSKKLSIPIDNTICRRQRATLQQSGLNRAMRKANIKNAFILNKKCRYKHIAIVDDVLTTGYTLTEIARLFQAHGVEKIEIWCLARR